MEIISKELLKELLSRKNNYNKAYQSMIVFYKVYFDNAGFKAALEEVQKDLNMELNFHAAYYAYKKICLRKKKNKTGNNRFQDSSSITTEEKKFKDASDIMESKPKFNF